MKQSRLLAWIVFGIGAAYFVLPLLATVQFSFA